MNRRLLLVFILLGFSLNLFVLFTQSSHHSNWNPEALASLPQPCFVPTLPSRPWGFSAAPAEGLASIFIRLSFASPRPRTHSPELSPQAPPHFKSRKRSGISFLCIFLLLFFFNRWEILGPKKGSEWLAQGHTELLQTVLAAEPRLGQRGFCSPRFLDYPALGGGQKRLFPQETIPPPHIRRLCGETKEGVSRGLRGHPGLPKGASSESEEGACRTPNIPGGEWPPRFP